jgi:hypothetical protein
MIPVTTDGNAVHEWKKEEYWSECKISGIELADEK